MKEFEEKSHELEFYIQSLQVHEKEQDRQKKRIAIGTVIIALVIALGISISFLLPSGAQNELPQIEAEDKVLVELQEKDPFADAELFAQSTEMEGFDPFVGTPNSLEDLELKIVVEGNKTVGEKLKLAIIGFDESFDYQIDLGNGKRQNISESIQAISYNKGGNYQLTLTVSNEQSEKRTYTRSIRIAPAASTFPSDGQEEGISPTPDGGASLENIPTQEFQEGPSLDSLLEILEPEDLSTEPISSLTQAEPARTSPIQEESSSPPQNVNLGDLVNSKDKEVFAEFPGGKRRLKRFLSQNIQYPKEALKNKIEGSVMVRFAVETDGSISNPTIVKGLGYGCDEEAIRIVTQMPNWNPGKLGTRAVRSYRTLSVVFKLM